MGGRVEGDGEGRAGDVVRCRQQANQSISPIGFFFSQIVHAMSSRLRSPHIYIHTRRMGRLEDPVRVFGVGDGLVPPFDLEVAGCLLEQGRSGETVDVEFGLWRHVP